MGRPPPWLVVVFASLSCGGATLAQQELEVLTLPGGGWVKARLVRPEAYYSRDVDVEVSVGRLGVDESGTPVFGEVFFRDRDGHGGLGGMAPEEVAAVGPAVRLDEPFSLRAFLWQEVLVRRMDTGDVLVHAHLRARRGAAEAEGPLLGPCCGAEVEVLLSPAADAASTRSDGSRPAREYSSPRFAAGTEVDRPPLPQRVPMDGAARSRLAASVERAAEDEAAASRVRGECRAAAEELDSYVAPMRALVARTAAAAEGLAAFLTGLGAAAVAIGLVAPPRGFQMFNPTSTCASSTRLVGAPCFETSTRAPKHEPNRLRCDRAREFRSSVSGTDRGPQIN